MAISVNGVEIDDAAIEREMPHHQDADNPLKRAVHELVLRTVLLQQADTLGILGDDGEQRIETLLSLQVQVPKADDAACQTWYRNNAARYTNGELVEARHILFQVTPEASLELLRATGEAVLEELKLHPERFAELAGEYSNCSSGKVGGSLGQLSRGQSVPEFEELAFRLAEGELAGRLLETRFGLHIVQVLRRVPGMLLPYEAVKSEIAAFLDRQSSQRAIHQYLHILVGQAHIEGMVLEGADSPLVQ
ncbi:MAG: peptidylprolyl isomerase [Pseudomonadota bacterium]